MKYYWVSDEIFQMKHFLSKHFSFCFRFFIWSKPLLPNWVVDQESIQVMLSTFPKAFSQMATSKMCNFLSSARPSIPVLTAAIDPHPYYSLRRLRRPYLTVGNLPLGKLRIWSCHLINYYIIIKIYSHTKI